jgi:glycosyltransferase involved in cell wall biosynthesis
MEAMAMGLPVVVTEGGGVGELVRDGTDGRLVPAHDPAALAAAIDGVLNTPNVAQRMGEAGALRVRKHFSSDISAGVIASCLGGENLPAGERRRVSCPA